MKVIVTGATGFLGSNLINALIESGNEVIAVVRNPDKIPDTWKNRVSAVCVDLHDISSLKTKGVNSCDTWYHLGWDATSGDGRANVELQLDNVLGTCNALRTAEEIGCSRFVNAGSIMEFEAMQYLSSEGCKPGLGYIYSTAKLCADYMAKVLSASRDISYTNIVISNIFGVGESSPRFLNSTVKKMLRNERIPLTEGKQLYDFIYISDAVRKFMFVGEHGEDSENYYLGNPVQKPLRDFVLAMKRVCESESELAFGDIPFDGPFLDYSFIDTRKLENLGCKNETTFEEGLIKTRNWIKETGVQ